MTQKQFQQLFPGDLVAFQQCGPKLNGRIVEVDQVWDSGEVVVPHPDAPDRLAVLPYRSLRLYRHGTRRF